MSARASNKKRRRRPAPSPVRITNLYDPTVDQVVAAGRSGGLGYLKKSRAETLMDLDDFRQRLQALGYSSYDDYLHSPRWKALRRDFHRACAWRCTMCPSKINLELHHKTYERLGEEHLEDLVPLCRACHDKIHKMQRDGEATLDPASLSSLEPRRLPKRTGPRHTRLQNQKQRTQDAEQSKTRIQHRTRLLIDLSKRLAAHDPAYDVKAAKRLIKAKARAERSKI